jgi:hypothetical protein
MLPAIFCSLLRNKLLRLRSVSSLLGSPALAHCWSLLQLNLAKPYMEPCPLVMGAESRFDREISSSLVLPNVSALRSFVAVGLLVLGIRVSDVCKEAM